MIAVGLIGAGVFGSVRADAGLVRITTEVDGVPLTLVHSAGEEARPGAVVVHGFAGSARLMWSFADTLARAGYLVALPISVATARTRGRSGPTRSCPMWTSRCVTCGAPPGQDPTRTVLIGHSMGATAVTDYAAAHPDIAGVVALSLPQAPARSPGHALFLYGGSEFPAFAAAARQAAGPEGTSTSRAEVVPLVEHVSILYSAVAHERMLAWLDERIRPVGGPGPVHPTNRVVAAGPDGPDGPGVGRGGSPGSGR